MKKFIRTIAAVGIAFAATLVATPADAATFTWSSRPLTNLDSAGTRITGSITNFPTKSGLYIFQCVKAKVAGERPASDTCFDLAWVTAAGGQGATSAKDPISFTLKAQYATATKSIDCSVEECGVFFRYDRSAGTDTSEDFFLPMTFAASTTPVVTKSIDSIALTFNGVALTKNVPVNLGYRTKAAITATATSGLPVTVVSATPDCTYTNGSLTALKGSGVCALSVSTEGNDTFDVARANYPFILVPGKQKIALTAFGIKRDSTRVLPAETNFGTPIVYKSNSKLCKVELTLLMVGKGKGCVLTATAAGKDQMWLPAKSTIKVKIK
jgi:hypothetical protein